MSLSSKSEIRRCRPLLGTFVEITVSDDDEEKGNNAISAAFESMESVQRQMSVHEESSELSRLNREGAEHPVQVSRELYGLIRRADKLAAESNGAFDYTIAPILARWGLLSANLNRQGSGSWRDVLLLRGYQIYFLQPVAIDLGGIAKGYAVDRGVETLQQFGVCSGIVNAGGDLRAFGSESCMVHLRHPGNSQAFVGNLKIQESAFATSSPHFTEKSWQGRDVSHLVDGRLRAPITGAISVSVRAGECWLADALTKVVMNSPEVARKLLAKHKAEAFVVTA
ncbi:MAG: hypothetical protein JWM04_953 [Verrucomicrobiales bacterium]|nr:hypothetical protein [Verrucomicrobiales bacterium]